jgi:hypothetical protein
VWQYPADTFAMGAKVSAGYFLEGLAGDYAE